MTTLKSTKPHDRPERVILVGVLLPEKHVNPEDPLDEIRGLAESAGLEVVATMLQRRQKVDITTHIGSGKVEELKQLVEAHEADMILVDSNLSPGQVRNLEKGVGVKAIDRTEIILDIFATRARTHEAMLQVELAQLEYSLPRLKRMWTHLSRYKAGVGMRGPGEKQLEEDRRLVMHRIQDLKAKLAKVQARKEREVAGRTETATVSLVGYTNAGKSTLMNVLTKAEVYVADQLFATLDTRTRRWGFRGGGHVLLSDTVGFIRDLPHELVASFKATLEEARQADLLLHVVDASNPEAEAQIRAVKGVLAELDLADHPMLLVLNKCDRVADPNDLEILRAHHAESVSISAVSGEGLDRLEQAVRETLNESALDVIVECAAGDGRTQAFLAQHAQIYERTFGPDGETVRLEGRLPRRCLGALRDLGVTVLVPAPNPTGWLDLAEIQAEENVA